MTTMQQNNIRKAYISTHILTKRMTGCKAKSQLLKRISTHILTKRMTGRTIKKDNNKAHFNSHPHEEDDDRIHKRIHSIKISTHILTKRMTEVERDGSRPEYHFNSHPHEEDDHDLCVVGRRLQFHFNSHPHEEDDSNQDHNTPGRSISTHILTKRMTER